MAAASTGRFRLLEHAAVVGEFLATEAAAILGSGKPGSGNARTTHANRLHALGLLSREEDPVRYRITDEGRMAYEAVALFVGGADLPDPVREPLVVAILDQHSSKIVDPKTHEVDVAVTIRRRRRRNDDGGPNVRISWADE